MYGTDVYGCSESFESFCGLGIEGWFVGGKGDVVFPGAIVNELRGWNWSLRRKTDFASLIGSKPARLYIFSRPK